MRFRRSTSLFQNSLLSFFFTALQGLINFAAVVYLARVLVVTGFGLFSYTWAVAGMFQLLGSLGLPTYFSRQIARAKTDLDGLISDGISKSLLAGVLSAAILGLAIPIVPGLRQVWWLFAFWIVGLISNDINPRWVFSGLGVYWIQALIDTLSALLRLAVLILLVRSGNKISEAVLITSASFLVSTISGLIVLRVVQTYHITIIRASDFLHTALRSLPLGATSIVGIMYSGADVWLLNHFHGVAVVGIYSVAYRPIAFLGMFSGIFFQVVFPRFVSLGVASRDRAQRLLNVSLVGIMFVIVPAIVGALTVGTELMREVFGAAFGSGGIVFSALVWSWGIALMRELFYIVLLSQHKEKKFLRFFGICGLLNILLMLLLRNSGALGAAYALDITQACLLVLTLTSVLRDNSYRLAYVKSLHMWFAISAGITSMLLALYMIRTYSNIFITIFVCAAIYVLVAFGSFYAMALRRKDMRKLWLDTFGSANQS